MPWSIRSSFVQTARVLFPKVEQQIYSRVKEIHCMKYKVFFPRFKEKHLLFPKGPVIKCFVIVS